MRGTSSRTPSNPSPPTEEGCTVKSKWANEIRKYLVEKGVVLRG